MKQFRIRLIPGAVIFFDPKKQPGHPWPGEGKLSPIFTITLKCGKSSVYCRANHCVTELYVPINKKTLISTAILFRKTITMIKIAKLHKKPLCAIEKMIVRLRPHKISYVKWLRAGFWL